MAVKESRFLTNIALLSIVLGRAHGIETDAQALTYLSRFGYLSPSINNPNSNQMITEGTMTEALMEFQTFAGINQTGYLDSETLYYMNLPRCGIRDKNTNIRPRRYTLHGSKWKTNNLTYKISKYSKRMSKSNTDEEVRRAFQLWADVTPLTFIQKETGPVHIEIKFAKGDHGDEDPFDGQSNTLAHAYYPEFGGDAHFDESEEWTIGYTKNDEINFYQVAAHEFGHSLGLAHSELRSALMAPFYRHYDPKLKLHEDDIKAIQKLYGPKNYAEEPEEKKIVTQETTLDTEDSNDEFCADVRVDTIFTTTDKETYVFNGIKYWKVTEKGLASGYPKDIVSTWPRLPGYIDAAFTLTKNKTYFFKNNKYWRYTGTTLDEEYPKYISSGFKGIPDNIDSALVLNESGTPKIYFFKGTKFWKYDLKKDIPLSAAYPKFIRNYWDGVPDNMDATFQYTNGLIYFFKDDKYYRLKEQTSEVDTSAYPPFPRNSGSFWFGCKTADDLQKENNVTVFVKQESTVKRLIKYYESISDKTKFNKISESGDLNAGPGQDEQVACP